MKNRSRVFCTHDGQEHFLPATENCLLFPHSTKLGMTRLAYGSSRYHSQLRLVRKSTIFLAGKKQSWPHGCRKLSISTWFVTVKSEQNMQKILVFWWGYRKQKYCTIKVFCTHVENKIDPNNWIIEFISKLNLKIETEIRAIISC